MAQPDLMTETHLGGAGETEPDDVVEAVAPVAKTTQ
jgi:hypothetical protein